MIPHPDRFIKDYCSLDLETTGLQATKNEIIEVGIVKVRDGIATERMDVLIRPKNKHIPAAITKITGIHWDMLKEAPSIEEVRDFIWSFIGDDVIVGYNVRFDLRFLAFHAPIVKAVRYIDVLPLCRKGHPELEHHRLTDMTRKYRLHRNTHRAFDDAFATAQLFEKSKKWVF